MDPLQERVEQLGREEVGLEPYDPAWPARFREEAERLRACLPRDLIGRIEHIGSTAVPGLAAKPVVDLLVEVASLEETKRRVVPVLVAQGYEYFWRPTLGDDIPPWYAWFIRRDAAGRRTHHVHMVEASFPHWDRVLFRDYLIEFPAVAAEYEAVKRRLAAEFPHDRRGYTLGKTEFVVRVTAEAVRRYRR